MITIFFINALLLRVPQIVIFGMLGRRQFFLNLKGWLEPQKVEKHCSVQDNTDGKDLSSCLVASLASY